MYNIIIKHLSWKDNKYTIDIHSSEQEGDDLPHIYQIKQFLRPNTRRQNKRRKLNVSKNETQDLVQITETIKLPYSIANELILKQHYH